MKGSRECFICNTQRLLAQLRRAAATRGNKTKRGDGSDILSQEVG